ncbi:MAG: DUF3667 domain-containing protein [Cyclobacteriaceae bacterium]
MRHIAGQDYLVSIFYLKRSMFTTLASLFTRPGHTVREYVEGKRVEITNPLSLLVVVVLAFGFLEHYADYHLMDVVSGDRELARNLEHLLAEHPKIFYISMIPFYAVISFLLFRRAGHNFAEHIIMNVFRSVVLVVLTVIHLVTGALVNNLAVMVWVSRAFSIMGVVYGTWLIYQYFSPFYRNKLLLLLRALTAYLLPFVLFVFGWLIVEAAKG